MRRLIRAASAGSWPADAAQGSLTLGFLDRNRRRIRLATDSGEAVFLDLPQAAALAEGDGLAFENGGWLVVHAAPEDVLEIGAADACHLARLAWHLSNRHLPVEMVKRCLPAHRLRPRDRSDAGGPRRPLRAPAVALPAGDRRLCRRAAAMVESSDRAQPGLLELLARFSPAMPTGAFSYSHGLEWAVEVALVHDAPTLRGYVEAILRQGSGRVDAIFLCAAYGASIAGEFEGRSLDDLGTASPLVDWCSIRHETQYTGLFRS